MKWRREQDLKTITNGTCNEHDITQDFGAYKFLSYNNRSPPTDQNTTDLKVLQTSSWSYAGRSLHCHSSDLPPSLSRWSSNTFSDHSTFINLLCPLLAYLRAFLSDADINHYWLTIRATRPMHEYDNPRWHVDDDFFAGRMPGVGFLEVPASTPQSNLDSKRGSKNERVAKEKRWKICTTLLGPSTLFLQDVEPALATLHATRSELRSTHEHPCSSLRCLGCATYANDVRSTLATKLSTYSIASCKSNEVAFFRIGNNEGAVHSEPKCDVDRIFVNVVPGTEEELKALMKRWGMGFPRAWCLGGNWVRGDEKGELEGWWRQYEEV